MLITGTMLKQNLEEGKKYLEMAAKNGNNFAITKIGEYMLYGNDLYSQNTDKAIEHFEKAINEDKSYLEPVYHLFNGKGPKINIFTKYNPAACINLACLYISGNIIEKNEEKATELINRVYEQGFENEQMLFDNNKDNDSFDTEYKMKDIF